MDLTSSVFQQAITKFTLTKALEMSVQLSNEAPKGVRNFNFSLLKNAHLKKKNHFLLIGGLVNKKKKITSEIHYFKPFLINIETVLSLK